MPRIGHSEHQIGEMPTFELREYRAELERALRPFRTDYLTRPRGHMIPSRPREGTEP